LQLPAEWTICTYRISELAGKTVMTGSSSHQSNLAFSTETLAPGVYIIDYFNSTNEHFSSRFVKQ
jgi:hypothetical protein